MRFKTRFYHYDSSWAFARTQNSWNKPEWEIIILNSTPQNLGFSFKPRCDWSLVIASLSLICVVRSYKNLLQLNIFLKLSNTGINFCLAGSKANDAYQPFLFTFKSSIQLPNLLFNFLQRAFKAGSQNVSFETFLYDFNVRSNKINYTSDCFYWIILDRLNFELFHLIPYHFICNSNTV